MKERLSLATIRVALLCIPADLPRDEWAKIAMALKSELGEAGFELFDTWSQGGQSYGAKSTRETWRSVKAGGRVTIGTLLHMAKQHGFKLDHTGTQITSTPEQRKAAAQVRAERNAREQAELNKAQRAAAAKAARLWSKASETGESAYLARKGVQGYGVRYLPDGTLCVPMRDVAGELCNLQRILPVAPASGTDKLFLRGGRKSGLLHWCADPANAPALLIAEGYATAASICEATGRPVAVAFDAGNLQPVACALRKRHSQALLVICGDDDRDTEARTCMNPGRAKAGAAATAVRGIAVFPDALPDGGSDFNDMHAHAGVEAVRQCIEAAIRDAKAHTGDGAKAQAAGTKPAPAVAPLDRFTVNDEGVWFTEIDNEGRARPPLWVCSRLDVPASTRDADGQGWGYLLTFADPLGHARQWAMPARMLAGDGTEFRATLLNMGLKIAPGTKARNRLAQYIQTRQPAEHARCTDRVGWHGRAFVLPRETLGDADERIVFQTDGTIENTFRQRGTIEGWREHVARLCVGNSRPVFAVSCAFAGVMLRPASIDSGGFHLRGDSSNGKTTALRVAASVYGGASYMQRWRSTDNALESIAAQHCDGLLILDELAQVDPKTAGECAYMLANETSKARSTRTGQPRPRLTWRLLFLSAGEIGLAAHMAEGGKRARAGQELRMADIPADAGGGLGLFEQLHGHEGGAALAQALAKAAEAQHGTAGRAFLAWAVSNADTLKDRVHADVDRLAGQWIPEAASGQVDRVARRFAVVGAAGELATAAGITGWPEGEAARAARICFHAWLASRGGIGNAEDFQMLSQVRAFLEAHGEGRFTDWSRAERNDDHAPKTLHRAGFRKSITDAAGFTEYEYYLLKDVFRKEVCAGFDAQAVARLLRDREHLVTDRDRFTDSARVPGMGRVDCYRIKASIFQDMLGS